jgi:hypothetical protein
MEDIKPGAMRARSGQLCARNSRRLGGRTVFRIAASSQCVRRSRAPSNRLPSDWRKRLPDPARYYAQHVEKLGHPNSEGWASARCPFHEDRNASLSVKLRGRGHWRCFAGCGHGDMVTFHERITSKAFKGTVRDLLGLRGAA